MRLVFLGPPGAGKGTQAEKLAAEISVPHISTGDIFRRHIQERSELGRKIARFADRGMLVPDELVVRVVQERLKEDDCAGGYVLDGFPRTRAQAEALDETLTAMGSSLDAVVYFSVPDDVVVERLSGRRSCPKCGANYHVVTLPSSSGELCERCGAKLVHREDDKPETVKRRLKVYYEQTAELIDYYRTKGLLKEINGDQAIDEIYSEAREALNV